MSIRKLLILSILLVAPAMSALTATEVLDKVVGNFLNAPSISISLTAQAGKTSMAGQLVMAREKFKYKSGAMDVYYDGTTQWTVDGSSKEISLTNPTLNELSEINPLAFVTSYKKNYSVSMVSQSGGTYTVKLTANKKSAFVRSAQVVVNSSTWMPTQVNAVLANGQSMTVRITSATKGKALTINDFRFNPKSKPDFEVIDLR